MAAIASPHCMTTTSSFLFRHKLKPSLPQLHFLHPNTPRRRGRMASSDAGNAETAGNKEDVLIQYVVLRRDLIDTWPLGSMVTQGCHAAVAAIWSHKDDSHTLDYCSASNLDSMHKVLVDDGSTSTFIDSPEAKKIKAIVQVTLEVKGEPQMRNLSEKLIAGDIAHKLWIEQPENIPSCLATKPYPKSVVSPFFRKLKLCK